jgi:hypothetical protein
MEPDNHITPLSSTGTPQSPSSASSAPAVPPGASTPPNAPAPSIRYLRRREIDTTQWDACIDNALNRLIYGHSFYLDAMADGQWDALVLGDYLAVMPLPWRSRAGIRYLYQPSFTQQTGIFSAEQVPPVLVEAFLEKVRRHFRFAEIYLNYGNSHPRLQEHANFILPLDAPYDQLAANFKQDLTRNLRHTERLPLNYVKAADLATALENYRIHYGDRTPHVRSEDYHHFAGICFHWQQKGQLVIRGVIGDKQQWLATAILLQDKRRLTLLQSTTLPAGRPLHANHYLLDQLIREWAGSGFLLDFEGSDIPGIAHFYKNFGSVDQPYYFYRHNGLPWPISLFKHPSTNIRP